MGVCYLKRRFVSPDCFYFEGGLRLPFPNIQEILQHHPHHIELVIDLGFFDTGVRTGRWGDTACPAASPAQEDSSWSKAEAKAY